MSESAKLEQIIKLEGQIAESTGDRKYQLENELASLEKSIAPLDKKKKRKKMQI